MNTTSVTSSRLVEEAISIAKQFEFTKSQVIKATKHFQRQINEGLAKKDTTLSLIPSYVTSIPTGKEKGLFLAIDLGGTNFRVCSVDLHGDHTYTINQSKVSIPLNLMIGCTSHELFSFLALHIQKFLQNHHSDHLERLHGSTNNYYRLGFTFSFAFEQQSLNRGTLIKWTKGFDIPDMIGKEVCSLLQEELDKLQLPVIVTALVNDTVGALMARAYTSPTNSETILGGIFGTGTNGAYVEHLRNITKMSESLTAHPNDLMVINTEWGGFDDELSVLPVSSYDIDLDRESVNPNDQHFEKLISGMYLGEILRRIIVQMARSPELQPLLGFNLNNNSPILQQWSIDSSLLSILAADEEKDLRSSRTAIGKALDVENITIDVARSIKILADAIGRRAARLAGVAVAAIVLHTGSLQKYSTIDARASGKDGKPLQPYTKAWKWVKEFMSNSFRRGIDSFGIIATFIIRTSGIPTYLSRFLKHSEVPTVGNHISTNNNSSFVDIGLDGSLIEFYPGFEAMMRSALQDVDEIGSRGNGRIRIGLAKDGSGVGAALIAWAALQQELGQ